MEFIAYFVWPAIAFGVIAYLGWSVLPKERRPGGHKPAE